MMQLYVYDFISAFIRSESTLSTRCDESK